MNLRTLIKRSPTWDGIVADIMSVQSDTQDIYSKDGQVSITIVVKKDRDGEAKVEHVFSHGNEVEQFVFDKDPKENPVEFETISLCKLLSDITKLDASGKCVNDPYELWDSACELIEKNSGREAFLETQSISDWVEVLPVLQTLDLLIRCETFNDVNDTAFSLRQQDRLNTYARSGRNTREDIVDIVELATTLSNWGWNTKKILEVFKLEHGMAYYR